MRIRRESAWCAGERISEWGEFPLRGGAQPVLIRREPDAIWILSDDVGGVLDSRDSEYSMEKENEKYLKVTLTGGPKRETPALRVV